MMYFNTLKTIFGITPVVNSLVSSGFTNFQASLCNIPCQWLGIYHLVAWTDDTHAKPPFCT
jgi:hypothetical protein